MRQDNNHTNPQNHYPSGVPYTTAQSNYQESHCYQVQHPATMAFDTTPSYVNFKDENEAIHGMYPTMSTALTPGVIENNLSSNCHPFTSGEYNNEQAYYQQQPPTPATTNSDANATTNDQFPRITNMIPNYSHVKDNGDPNHLINNSQNRKRGINSNTFVSAGDPSAYGYGTHGVKPKNDKTSKGLRHFSMKVCEKVQQKKITTYNEVADELVSEFGETDRGPGNEQNIRRRVYDALNVLMAMNIISKDKKEIRWLGLPSNSTQEHQRLKNEGIEIYESIKGKLKTIYELIIQQVSLQNLINYNKKLESEMNCKVSPEKCIQLPFLVLTTPKNTDVVCRINDQKNKYDISFSSAFELNDDSEILKRLGFTCNLDNPNCSMSDLTRSLQLVPPNLSYYVKAMAGRSVVEFQEHILNNRGYLYNDEVMEFYNRISKTIFEVSCDTPSKFPPGHPSPPNNIDNLNYGYTHTSMFPHSDNFTSVSNNDNDHSHPLGRYSTQEDGSNERYSISSSSNVVANAASPYSNEMPNDIIHQNSNDVFVQPNSNFNHLVDDNDVPSESVNALNNQHDQE